MSHFTVLVIGDDVDKLLAPFNEQPNEDDEDCKPFMTWTVYGAKEEYHGDTKEEAEKACADAGDTIQEGPYCSNSQSKWDWYQIGGRWKDMIKLKDGATTGLNGNPSLLDKGYKKIANTADSAYIKDVDFEGMSAKAAEEAAERYDGAMTIFGEAPVNEEWDVMRERLSEIGYPTDDIRKMYHKQPRMVAAKLAIKENPEQKVFNNWSTNIDQFLCTKEEYVERAKKQSFSTYAVLRDGEWHEKGSMGWFGMSANDMDEDEWLDKYHELLSSLDPETRITVVDCHI
jgi:hypothetical protein